MFSAAQERLVSPRCPFCSSASRLVGIEPDVAQPELDIFTYDCVACGHMFTLVDNRQHPQATSSQ
jgi:hypothetical protein